MSDGTSTPGNPSAVGRAVVPPAEPAAPDGTAPAEAVVPGPADNGSSADRSRGATRPSSAVPSSGGPSSGSVAASVAGTSRRPAGGQSTGAPTSGVPGGSRGRTRPPVSRGSASVPPVHGTDPAGTDRRTAAGTGIGSTGARSAGVGASGVRPASAPPGMRPMSAPPGARPTSAPPGVRPASGPPSSAMGEAVRTARATVTAAAARSPRRARLQLRRIDPWSVMKFAFAVSLVIFVVLVVATSVLYVILDGMGVFASVNDTIGQFLGSGSDGTAATFKITAKGVIGGAALLGVLNTVVSTALSTLGAFIYNVCSDLVGGVEVTLAERD